MANGNLSLSCGPLLQVRPLCPSQIWGLAFVELVWLRHYKQTSCPSEEQESHQLGFGFLMDSSDTRTGRVDGWTTSPQRGRSFKVLKEEETKVQRGEMIPEGHTEN